MKNRIWALEQKAKQLALKKHSSKEQKAKKRERILEYNKEVQKKFLFKLMKLLFILLSA